ncbi:MAG: 50S ribosomal protein L9 [Actinobacteria bacterium]|nr:50S ribosomal protein L9 [Actinomycetota bacterium]
MKVILLEDVKSLGKKGDIVEVSAGYGQNFLLPRKMAAEATKGNLEKLSQKQDALRKKQERVKNDALEIAKTIEESTFIIKCKAGEKGKLFGSITIKDIAEAICSVLKVEIDKKKISFDEQIKSLGDYVVFVKLHPEVKAKAHIRIVRAED